MRAPENVIVHIHKGSPAWNGGLRPGDRVLSVNGHRINDTIDWMFYTSDEGALKIVFERDGKKHTLLLERDEGEPIGLELGHMRVKRCKNRCVFCFVNQLPKGLRKSLYVKDEDFRLSFLYGNYITLTNLSEKEKKRIVQQRLSPLYVSVHTTNPALRQKMLGNDRAGNIMEEIEFMASHRIKMHTQIVLCPGYNDGEELDRTIKDLGRFYPYVESIAVVPVGVTRFVKTDIRPLSKEEAQDALTRIAKAQRRFKKRFGEPVVYGADELYILADKKFPSVSQYGGLPQIENGVGMVPLFLYRARKARLPKRWSKRRFVTITGVSFYPFLRNFIEKLKAYVNIDLLKVHNWFFGENVTVTGLLTGKDILREFSEHPGPWDRLLLPDIVLRAEGDLLLDDTRPEDLSSILGLEVKVIESTPEGLLSALEERDGD